MIYKNISWDIHPLKKLQNRSSKMYFPKTSKIKQYFKQDIKYKDKTCIYFT